jgi:hypothetical protein
MKTLALVGWALVGVLPLAAHMVACGGQVASSDLVQGATATSTLTTPATTEPEPTPLPTSTTPPTATTPPPDPTARPPVTFDARFIGHWGVEETVAHALDARGALRLADLGGVTWRVDVAFEKSEWEALRSVTLKDGERCVLGDRWRSEGPGILWMNVVCTKRGSAQARIEVSPDASKDSLDLPVQRVTVNGKEGKLGGAFGFRMFRCLPTASRSECRPF